MAGKTTLGIPTWLVGIIVIAVIVQVAYPGGLSGAYTDVRNYQQAAPVAPVAPVTSQLAQPGTTAYSGPISLKVTSTWIYDDSALALTNAHLNTYDSNMNFLATMTEATAGTIVISPADNGVMYLVIEDLTQTVGYVDPDYTISKSSGYITSWSLKDVDNNGQKDIVFKLNVASLSIKAGQTAATLNILNYAWKAMTNAGSLTNISSPTGMTTAGDYHNTFYYDTWTGEGYELRLVKVQIYSTNASGVTNSSSNSGSIGALFNAGTVQLKSLIFRGTSASSSVIPTKVYGQEFGGTSWDNSNSYFQLWQATYQGVTDVTQTNYGMPFVYDRQAGASFLQGDLWLHTSSSAMTSGSKYYLTITLTFQSPAAATFTETLTLTLTG